MVWVSHEDFEGLHRRMSSTYWMSLLGKKSRELRSCCMVWPKRWGESLNSWERTVQVNCWVWWVMASIHVKANNGWEDGCQRIIKKASLRSRTEKRELGEESGREECMCQEPQDDSVNRALVFLRS
jgi:hypothetical protein